MLNGRARVIGEKTFGKGVIQYFFPLNLDGSGLKVTVAKYTTPLGHDIARQGGIEPDSVCHDHPREHVPSTPAAIADACLREAVGWLEEHGAATSGAANAKYD